MDRGINLIPAPILQQRTERRRARRGLRITAGYLALLLIGTLSYLGLHMPGAAVAKVGESAVTADQVALLEKNVAATQLELSEARRRLEGGRVLSERPEWGTLLRLVAAAGGDEIMLRRFSLSTTGPTIGAGATLQLGGIARDPWTVSSFALRLEDSRIFDRVTIESSDREPFGQQTATAFSLRCELLGADTLSPEEAR